MIYFCADDYGLCSSASLRIKKCVDYGILNKVSALPNMDEFDLNKLNDKGDIRISLHLNLVEGKCMSTPDELNLIADKSGNFRHQFGGLLKLSLFKKKEFETQVYKEIRSQVLFWKNMLPCDMPFCIDSHQHTHMIPSVFRMLKKVLEDEEITLEYLRIPAEPILPFLKTPSLYFTYNPVNVIKQLLLNFLWIINKKYVKNLKLPTTLFFGILFSGKMDEKRVLKVLPKFIKMAKGRDIEVLFHPGYIDEHRENFKNKNIGFEKFYYSENRKTEFDSVIKISERSVL